jgi:TM2 domain-containing membrane protein YozV
MGRKKYSKPPLSRVLYVITAILVGSLGIHNFMSGHHILGGIKLGLTAASFGGLAPIMFLWALYEAVFTKRDKEGQLFSS